MNTSFLVTDVVETKFNQMFSDLPSRLFPAQGARSALQRRAEEKEQFDQQVHIFVYNTTGNNSDFRQTRRAHCIHRAAAKNDAADVPPPPQVKHIWNVAFKMILRKTRRGAKNTTTTKK